MAICRICGTEDRSLPLGWKNWECWQCFGDGFVTYTNIEKFTNTIMADLTAKRDRLNMVLIDSQMAQALEEAEAHGRR